MIVKISWPSGDRRRPDQALHHPDRMTAPSRRETTRSGGAHPGHTQVHPIAAHHHSCDSRRVSHWLAWHGQPLQIERLLFNARGGLIDPVTDASGIALSAVARDSKVVWRRMI